MSLQKHFEFANKMAKEGHFFKDKAWPPIRAALNEIARSNDAPATMNIMAKEEFNGTMTLFFAPIMISTGIIHGAAGKAGAYIVNLAKGPN